MIDDHYETLEVSRKASDEVIRKAYQALQRKYHPDNAGDVDRAKAINEAYRVLSHTDRRADYDQLLLEVEANTSSPEPADGDGFDESHWAGTADWGNEASWEEQGWEPAQRTPPSAAWDPPPAPAPQPSPGQAAPAPCPPPGAPTGYPPTWAPPPVGTPTPAAALPPVTWRRFLAGRSLASRITGVIWILLTLLPIGVSIILDATGQYPGSAVSASWYYLPAAWISLGIGIRRVRRRRATKLYTIWVGLALLFLVLLVRFDGLNAESAPVFGLISAWLICYMLAVELRARDDRRRTG